MECSVQYCTFPELATGGEHLSARGVPIGRVFLVLAASSVVSFRVECHKISAISVIQPCRQIVETRLLTCKNTDFLSTTFHIIPDCNCYQNEYQTALDRYAPHYAATHGFPENPQKKHRKNSQNSPIPTIASGFRINWMGCSITSAA